MFWSSLKLSLFLGTILVDTINRSPYAGKTTPRDEVVLEKLQNLLPNVKGDNLFNEIQKAKFDISGKQLAWKVM